MRQFFYFITIVLCVFSALSAELYNFLTDGTEVKIVDGKVYAVCHGKFQLAAAGQYELADGSSISVQKDGRLGNLAKAKKWKEYVSESELDQQGEIIEQNGSTAQEVKLCQGEQCSNNVVQKDDNHSRQ